MDSIRFRCVYCQLDRLRHCIVPNMRRILRLDELPQTLDETYGWILWEISKENREHAHRLLQCLTVAYRPLCAEELTEILAIDFTDSGTPKLNVDFCWEDLEEEKLFCWQAPV
jgi:hypothetical protein